MNDEQKLKKKREKNIKLASPLTLCAGVVGDLVGDIQKSCSGPGINILMKFMAIFAVACFRLFDSRAVLECVLAPNSAGCKWSLWYLYITCCIFFLLLLFVTFIFLIYTNMQNKKQKNTYN